MIHLVKWFDRHGRHVATERIHGPRTRAEAEVKDLRTACPYAYFQIEDVTQEVTQCTPRTRT